MVTVTAVQVQVSQDETPGERLARVADWLTSCPAGDLVVLPELWTVGAFDIEAMLAEAQSLDGTFVATMRQVARTLGTTVHAGSFPERHDAGVSNTSVVVGPDGDILATYRKIHLFGFDTGEATAVVAGTEIVQVPSALGPTGLTTCYDLRFPELYRELTADGSEAFLVPAGWPRARIEHWRVLLQARAIEDQAVVVGANAVGVSAGVPMGGRSAVVAADGVVVAEADGESEQFLTAVVERGADWRRQFPTLRDRRR